jgi:hypothetical protein
VKYSHFIAWSAGVALALFVAMLVFLELGRRFGLHRAQKDGAGARTGVGVVDGTVYGLLGLLLGFVFSGAAGRFDDRRVLIAQEASAISTAWLRIDALPPEPQLAIRAGFRSYVDALLATYSPEVLGDPFDHSAELIRAEKDIWARSIAACMSPEGEKARMLLLPAVNEMFDAVDRERAARRMDPPPVIFLMLGVMALAAALFGGYALSSSPTRNWMYIIGVAATISSAVYVILELEYPRLGLVQVDAVELARLRAMMN